MKLQNIDVLIIHPYIYKVLTGKFSPDTSAILLIYKASLERSEMRNDG